MFHSCIICEFFFDCFVIHLICGFLLAGFITFSQLFIENQDFSLNISRKWKTGQNQKPDF